MAHRRIHGEMPRVIHPLVDIVRDDHPFVVIQKSAQIGLTELLVNLGLWACDTRLARRGHVLFLMPTQNQMDDFTQARFDTAIQDSAHLRRRMQPEPPRRKGADRKRLKRIGDGYLFLRGADSIRQIASVDADLVLLDEFDQMSEEVLTLARKRIASSLGGRIVIASTPRLPDLGIHALYQQSDQRRYYLTCDACAVEQPLTWAENVDRDRACIVCRSCRAPLDTLKAGRWVAETPGNAGIRGYQLSRLYSPWCDIRSMLEASRRNTPAELQEFHNSDLGEAFAPAGGKLSPHLIDGNRREYDLADYAGQPCDMGVDVGSVLHVVIREHVPADAGTDAEPRLWFAAELPNFEALTALLQRFSVRQVVVDALPEQHAAQAFVRAHAPSAWVAYYSRYEGTHEWRHDSLPQVHADRSALLDTLFAAFHARERPLPRDARTVGGRFRDGLGEYYRELCALTRSFSQDRQENWGLRWTDGGKPDHYAHAEAYCLLASQRVLVKLIID